MIFLMVHCFSRPTLLIGQVIMHAFIDAWKDGLIWFVAMFHSIKLYQILWVSSIFSQHREVLDLLDTLFMSGMLLYLFALLRNVFYQLLRSLWLSYWHFGALMMLSLSYYCILRMVDLLVLCVFCEFFDVFYGFGGNTVPSNIVFALHTHGFINLFEVSSHLVQTMVPCSFGVEVLYFFLGPLMTPS